jgi:hypothetical protein
MAEETFEYHGARCPYCRHVHVDAWEWRLPNDKWEKVECENCNMEFEVEKSEMVSYSGRPLPKEDTDAG